MNNMSKNKYITHLINRLFKLLPLYEISDTLPIIYMDRLYNDVVSANDIFNGDLIQIVTILYSIKNNNSLNHKLLRSSVFECINVCKKIINEISLEE